MRDLFRQSLPSISTEEKGAGAKVEEAQAGQALPAPTTQHPGGAVGRPAPSAHVHEHACTQGWCQGTEYQQQFV